VVSNWRSNVWKLGQSGPLDYSAPVGFAWVGLLAKLITPISVRSYFPPYNSVPVTHLARVYGYSSPLTLGAYQVDENWAYTWYFNYAVPQPGPFPHGYAVFPDIEP
jgi:hypothetical protein